MSFNTPLDKTSRSNIDIRYEEIKKLMKELDDMSDNFDSVILAQVQFTENNTTPSSFNQNNKTISNSKSIPTITINPSWGFIRDKDLFREKEKLLKHLVK